MLRTCASAAFVRPQSSARRKAQSLSSGNLESITSSALLPGMRIDAVQAVPVGKRELQVVRSRRRRGQSRDDAFHLGLAEGAARLLVGQDLPCSDTTCPDNAEIVLLRLVDHAEPGADAAAKVSAVLVRVLA